MANDNRLIIPNLWFDREAEEAVNLYTSSFSNSKILNMTRASKAGFEIHGIPAGTVMNIEFELAGQRFIGINGGPIFKFNPSISFLVSCGSSREVDALWSRLAEGGSTLMELGKYPFSERYGWRQDRYGLSWQIMLNPGGQTRQKITPTLMFTGKADGRAEEAVNLYTSIFHNSSIDHIQRYGKGEPSPEGTIRHAGFAIEGQNFAAMDGGPAHDFTFNEAVSLMILCEDQQQIDYYWDKLIAKGGEESNCGWLKDRFGVSWQVSPVALGEMLRDTDTAKVERVTNKFLKMKKFDISSLKKAFEGG